MKEAMKKYSQSKYKSMSQLIECFGVHRDTYYKYQQRANRTNATIETLLAMAKERRRDLPREGGKKMYQALKKEFRRRDIKLGRDGLYDILRERDMLVTRKRSFVKTTNSYHRFHKYNNLIKEINIYRPRQFKFLVIFKH